MPADLRPSTVTIRLTPALYARAVAMTHQKIVSRTHPTSKGK